MVDSIAPEEVLDFTVPFTTLDDIHAVIAEHRRNRVSEVRSRLDRELPGADASFVERVQRALDQGDFLAANEYIDAALDGRDVAPEVRDEPFDHFFPEFTRQAYSFAGKPGFAENQRVLPRITGTGHDGLKPRPGRSTDVLVFLISPDSLKSGRYTRRVSSRVGHLSVALGGITKVAALYVVLRCRHRRTPMPASPTPSSVSVAVRGRESTPCPQ
jgi:hypothetical protein